MDDLNPPSDRFFDQFGAPREQSLPFPGRRAARSVASQGSGFFISSDGYVVTNNHVTEGSDTVEIWTDDQNRYTARVVAADTTSDLALLKVDGRNDFSYVKFADKVPRVGDWIFAVGNPFGLGGTVTAGIVSARERNIGAKYSEDLIQVDAPINKGNSGGPSFDLDGNVIGVISLILSPSGGSIGIGFAIPAEIVKSVVSQLKEKGAVTRGSISVQMQSVTPAIAEVLNLPQARGALVAEAGAGGPAMNAGIVSGDVITSFDGEMVKDNRDLARRIGGAAPGTSVALGIIRKGEAITVGVTLGGLPARAASTQEHRAQRPRSAEFGLRLAPKIDVSDSERRGVVVIGIDPGGLAADLGFEAGDVILEVSGSPVRTPDDVRKALSDARGASGHAVLVRVKSGEAVRFIAVPVEPV
jgi:serine protease Do